MGNNSINAIQELNYTNRAGNLYLLVSFVWLFLQTILVLQTFHYQFQKAPEERNCL